jgi:inorganic triphosphatase YgiF
MTSADATEDPAAEDPAAGPLEIEVKLGVSRPQRIARMVRDFGRHRLAGFEPLTPPRIVMLTDRYLDTVRVDGRLQAAGMRARLRTQGRNVIVAIKRDGVERAGVTVRVELEAAATSSRDPRHWPASPARDAIIEAIGGEHLTEIAVLRQRRLVRTLGRGATTVDLSLDRVDAVERGRVLARRHELEAELRSGQEADLAALAEVLRHVDGLVPAVGSKLAFGLSARKSMARQTAAREPSFTPER